MFGATFSRIVAHVTCPKDVKVIAEDDMYVNEAGDMRLKSTQHIVNLRGERYIKLKDILETDRPIAKLPPGMYETEAEVKRERKVGRTTFQVDEFSKKKVRRYEEYVHYFIWTKPATFTPDTMNYYYVPRTKREVRHTIKLSTQKLPIVFYLGDETDDASILKRSDEDLAKYAKVRKAQAKKVLQPTKLNETTLQWTIEQPKEEQIYTLFFEYRPDSAIPQPSKGF